MRGYPGCYSDRELRRWEQPLSIILLEPLQQPQPPLIPPTSIPPTSSTHGRHWRLECPPSWPWVFPRMAEPSWHIPALALMSSAGMCMEYNSSELFALALHGAGTWDSICLVPTQPPCGADTQLEPWVGCDNPAPHPLCLAQPCCCYPCGSQPPEPGKPSW